VPCIGSNHHSETAWHPEPERQTGLFAFANAFTLCAGIEPESCAWNQLQMRNYLVRCLTEDKLSMFAVNSETRCNRGVVFTEAVPVFCSCRPAASRTIGPGPRQNVNSARFGTTIHRTCKHMPWPIWKGTRFMCQLCNAKQNWNVTCCMTCA